MRATAIAFSPFEEKTPSSTQTAAATSAGPTVVAAAA